MAMFQIGRNYAQGKHFLGNMDMPATIYKTSRAHHKTDILKETLKTTDKESCR